ncbi:MAG: hypothetical protein U0807_09895 [Candidatus Binatia bacterium]
MCRTTPTPELHPTIAAAIHPYPTQAEVMKNAGDAYSRSRLTPRVRRLFERWRALRR